MKQNTKTHVSKKKDFVRELFLANKMKIHSIALTQKEMDINRENNILFNKLVDISLGKMSQLPFIKSPHKQYFTREEKKSNISRYKSVIPPSHTTLSKSHMNSLPSMKLEEINCSSNFSQRRREKERIEKDNLRLATKLITTRSSLSKNKLVDDYKRNQKYK